MIKSYGLDLTGRSSDNYIVESHNSKETLGILVPHYYPFYQTNLLVQDEQSKAVLKPGVDYELRALHEPLTTQTGQGVYTLIVLKKPEDHPDITLSYQTVGGSYAKGNAAILRFLLDLLEQRNKVEWNDILYKPSGYVPQSHTHIAQDIEFKQEVLDALDAIEDAIINPNSNLFDQLLARINLLADNTGNTRYLSQALSINNAVSQSDLLTRVKIYPNYGPFKVSLSIGYTNAQGNQEVSKVEVSAEYNADLCGYDLSCYQVISGFEPNVSMRLHHTDGSAIEIIIKPDTTAQLVVSVEHVCHYLLPGFDTELAWMRGQILIDALPFEQLSSDPDLPFYYPTYKDVKGVLEIDEDVTEAAKPIYTPPLPDPRPPAPTPWRSSPHEFMREDPKDPLMGFGDKAVVGNGDKTIATTYQDDLGDWQIALYQLSDGEWLQDILLNEVAEFTLNDVFNLALAGDENQLVVLGKDTEVKLQTFSKSTAWTLASTLSLPTSYTAENFVLHPENLFLIVAGVSDVNRAAIEVYTNVNNSWVLNTQLGRPQDSMISGDLRSLRVTQDVNGKYYAFKAIEKTAPYRQELWLYTRNESGFGVGEVLSLTDAEGNIDALYSDPTLSSDGSELAIGFSYPDYVGEVQVYTFINQAWSRKETLQPYLLIENETFGLKVSYSGGNNTLLVSQTSLSVAVEGRVALYERIDSREFFRPVGFVTHTNRGEHEAYANDITFSLSGKVLLIGASKNAVYGTDAGLLYVYTSVPTKYLPPAIVSPLNWIEEPPIQVVSDTISATQTLALSGDGNTLAIGNPLLSGGNLNTYRRVNGTWLLMSTVAAPADSSFFARAMALDNKGEVLAVSSIEANVHLLFSEPTGWIRYDLPKPEVSYGEILTLSDDGNWLLVGAMDTEQAFLYQIQDRRATLVQTITSAQTLIGDGVLKSYHEWGKDISFSGDGQWLVIAATGILENDAIGAGVVYLFKRDQTHYQLHSTLRHNNPLAQDQFGHSTQLSGDGSVLAVAADWYDDYGSVFVFRYFASTDQWFQEHQLRRRYRTKDDRFGIDIAINDTANTLVVGTLGDDRQGLDKGGVQCFRFDGQRWGESEELYPSITPDAGYGRLLHLSSAGDVLSVVSPDVIHPFVLPQWSYSGQELTTGVWNEPEVSIIKPQYGLSKDFGRNISLSTNGSWLFATNEGVRTQDHKSVYGLEVFQWINGGWVYRQSLYLSEGSLKGKPVLTNTRCYLLAENNGTKILAYQLVEGVWISSDELPVATSSNEETIGVSRDGLYLARAWTDELESQLSLWHWDGAQWQAADNLQPDSDRSWVSAPHFSPDSQTIAILSNTTGDSEPEVDIYQLLDNDWVKVQTLSCETFVGPVVGASLSFSEQGHLLVSIARNTGSERGEALLFDSDWSLIHRFSELPYGADAHYGISSSINYSGDVVVIGEAGNRLEGRTHLYWQDAGGNWIKVDPLKHSPISNEEYGAEIVFGPLSESLIIGAPGNGSYGTGTGLIHTRNLGDNVFNLPDPGYVPEQEWLVQTEMSESLDATFNGNFGSQGWISEAGDEVILTSPKRLNPQTGVRGGGVSVYLRYLENWLETQTLTDPDEVSDSLFGQSLVVSLDKSLMVISAPRRGENAPTGVLVTYKKYDGQWQYSDTLESPNDQNMHRYGYTLSMNDAGTQLVVGDSLADRGGQVFYYQRIGDIWQLSHTFYGDVLSGSTVYNFGEKVTLSRSGQWLAISVANRPVGNGNKGAVAIIAVATLTLTQTLINQNLDGLGHTMVFSKDDSKLLIGAPDTQSIGAVQSFSWENQQWQSDQTLNPPDQYYLELSEPLRFGESVSIDSDGDILTIGAPGDPSNFDKNGSVYQYRLVNNFWEVRGKHYPDKVTDDEEFGVSQRLSGSGDFLLVNSPKKDIEGIAQAGQSFLLVSDDWVRPDVSGLFSFNASITSTHENWRGEAQLNINSESWSQNTNLGVNSESWSQNTDLGVNSESWLAETSLTLDSTEFRHNQTISSESIDFGYNQVLASESLSIEFSDTLGSNSLSVIYQHRLNNDSIDITHSATLGGDSDDWMQVGKIVVYPEHTQWESEVVLPEIVGD
ncbi:FG-GAP repeat protein [Endozoicomonas sp. ONNA1]|uniref:FG-GAP repeat protein n=1 Tax=Endozoicomonas sp. ONNA1 TaxID=2828740 RepID=UPI002147FA34|nr:FG-GAP repeat protein [Endozoicomonas sp. ONNA1]